MERQEPGPGRNAPYFVVSTIVISRPSIWGNCSILPTASTSSRIRIRTFKPKSWVRHFPAPETHRHLDLVAFTQEGHDFAEFHFVVVDFSPGAKLDLLDVDHLLLLFCLGALFALLIFELSVVEDFADGWIGGR